MILFYLITTLSYFTQKGNLMPLLKQGILISIEGIDGSGKSTLLKNLSAIFYQNNYDLVITKEPGDTPLGKKIRDIIVQMSDISCSTKAEFLLFATDRAQHFHEIIIPALNSNKLIISDRLADSSLAYQGYGRELDIEQIQSINHWAMNNVKPHLTIFVQIPVTIALKRISERSKELWSFEKEELLKKIAHGFEKMYKNRSNVIIIDGTQSSEYLTTKTYMKIETWIHKNNLLL